MDARYRFVDGEGEHRHELLVNGEWKPLIGTSTVAGSGGKPGLTWWAAGKALEAFGWQNPKLFSPDVRLGHAYNAHEAIKKMTAAAYEKKLQECYRAHDTVKNKAAKDGTDMHAELENYVRSCMAYWGRPQPYEGEHKAVKLFAAWAKGNVNRFLWSELHCFSETLWLGGISDVGALLQDGRMSIIDFKSAKEAYASMFMQIGGYDLQLTENGGYLADGEKVFELPKPIDVYFIIPFGAEKPSVIPFADVEGAREAFKGQLVQHKFNQAYNALQS
jgi:hypothetical protein